MLSINGLERPIAIYLYGRKMYEMLATPAAAASAGSGVRDCGAPAAESAGDDEVRSAGAGAGTITPARRCDATCLLTELRLYISIFNEYNRGAG